MGADNTIEIIQAICELIGGDSCSQWCVGVTADPEFLAEELASSDGLRTYFHSRAISDTEAHAIAKAFWNIECERGPVDPHSPPEARVYVFAFPKRTHLPHAKLSGEIVPQPPAPRPVL